MFTEKTLADCLLPVVGWRQNSNPDYKELTPSLLISESFRYFQDEHPLVCIENLDQALKNYDLFVYPAWSNAIHYYKTQHVKGSDNKVYESMMDNNLNHDPTTATADQWVVFEVFSQKLEAMTRSAISKVFNRVYTEKKLNEVSKTLMENILLYEGSGSMLNKEIKTGRFVGLWVTLNENRDLLTVIRRLGTQFSQANPEFPLYIFHSSQEEPIYKLELALTKTNSFEWTKISDENFNAVNLKWNADEYSPGGSFAIGYLEDDLQGMAINRDVNFTNGNGCATCGNNFRYFKAWSQYLKIEPFFVAADDLIFNDDDELIIWDVNKNQYQSGKTYGLNLDLTVRCDLTEFICAERLVFADAISKQVTVDVLNALAYSTRNNIISKETRDLANYELNNKDNGTPGATVKLDKAIKAISFELSDLNSACVPCNDSVGASWKTI